MYYFKYWNIIIIKNIVEHINIIATYILLKRNNNKLPLVNWKYYTCIWLIINSNIIVMSLDKVIMLYNSIKIVWLLNRFKHFIVSVFSLKV